jgi:catechol 2,3-dioxygenase-like lactoylglutathione lyase family enzyme
MTLPGRFLEISIHSPDVRASLDFYTRMGLVEAEPGDVWDHHYAVVSDGRIALGLHGYEFVSPALCWVLPGIAAFAPTLDEAGIELQFVKTGYEEFNELGYLDPDGQMLTVLEARTYSPSGEAPKPACGFFSEYRYPVHDLDASVTFWEQQGFVATGRQQAPQAQVSLTSDGIDLCLFIASKREKPTLVFEAVDLEQAADKLRSARLAPTASDDPVRGVPALTISAPEKTPIVIVQASEPLIYS